MTQRTKFKIIVYVLLLAIAAVLLAWFSMAMSAKARDYQRLSDLKIIQAKFTAYYFKHNTYRIDACNENSMVNSCSNDQIDLSKHLDPSGSGIYKYVIYSLSDTDYQIGFALETKMGGLMLGGHIYSKEGVIK